jgi:hypothetical protein
MGRVVVPPTAPATTAIPPCPADKTMMIITITIPTLQLRNPVGSRWPSATISRREMLFLEANPSALAAVPAQAMLGVAGH